MVSTRRGQGMIAAMGPLMMAMTMGCGGEPGLPTLPEAQRPEQAAPADAVGGFAVQMPALTLKPGQEREPCYIFPLQVDGPSRLVYAASVTVGAGLHHGNITTRPSTGEGVRPCPTVDHVAIDILSGGAVLFGSSTQVVGTEWQRFPKGMAYRIKDGFEIVARMHYLNATPESLTVAPKYQWYTMDEGALQQELTPFAWTYDDFTIPPQGDLTVTADCPLDEAMQVVSLLPHMHQRGTRISASFLGGPLDGKDFFAQSGYGARGDTDIRVYQPAVDVLQGGKGDGLRFSCAWHNELNKSLHYGVGDNEMCVIFGYGYPREATYSAKAGDRSVCVPLTVPK